MKKLSFISFFIIAMSFFMASCSENDLETGINSPDTGAGQKTKTPNYVSVLKPSSKSNTSTTKAVGVKSTYWTTGDVIRVKFLSDAPGTALYQQRVEEYAKIWEKHANITFQFVGSSESADVKIGVGYDDSTLSWSYLGTECQDYDDDEQTMNLMNFEDRYIDDDTSNGDSREDLCAIVLRQFGHVLGLQFEHMNPSNGSSYLKNLNTTETRAYLLRQGWDSMDIATMLKAYTNTNPIEYTDLDETSIMMLYFPDYLSNDGNPIGKYNLTLSSVDKAFVGKLYPFAKKKIGVTYAGDSNEYEYYVIRIGEYYWMEWNLYQPTVIAPTRAALDRALTFVGSTPSSYPVSMEDFNRYFGTYVDRATLEGKLAYPTIYEYNNDGSKTQVGGWDFGNGAGWYQLFAMCGDGSKADVKKYLGSKKNDNPCAYNPAGLTWFDGNENVYGFNMMPGASLFNGLQTDGTGRGAGDFDRFFQDDRFIAHSATVVMAPTYSHPRMIDKLFHWIHMRYQRRLTDQELGYKLYINSAKTDIKKLGLNEAAPSGYTELANGYLRGFYVQHIMDNPNPEKTISEIVQLASLMESNPYY